MRGQRTERLVRLAAKFMMCPSKLVSLTDLATKFNVSKTVISDDVEVINSAMEAEGFGQMMVDRGRSGGARFIPVCTPEYRRAFLTEIAEKLADPERNLPGGLIYYSDLIFNPESAILLGYCMASLFTETEPDVVMTSEVKGIPIAMFAAYALGVPLAVCRFRNRPSDGAAVGVHYPTASGDVKTMYIGTRPDETRRPRADNRRLHARRKHRGRACCSWRSSSDAEVAGIGVFIAYDEPKEKAVPEYRLAVDAAPRRGRRTAADRHAGGRAIRFFAKIQKVFDVLGKNVVEFPLVEGR